jgi:hypothetical protein
LSMSTPPLSCHLCSPQVPAPRDRALQVPLCKALSRLMLISRSSPDALYSITSFSVQLTS